MKLQNYNFILWYILEKSNTRADILFRKDQMDMTENNKDVKVFKNELWTRQVIIEAEIVIIREN